MEYPPGAIPTFLAPLAADGARAATTSRSSSRSHSPALGLILASRRRTPPAATPVAARMFATYAAARRCTRWRWAQSCSTVTTSGPRCLCVLALLSRSSRGRTGSASGCLRWDVVVKIYPAGRPSGRHCSTCYALADAKALVGALASIRRSSSAIAVVPFAAARTRRALVQRLHADRSGTCSSRASARLDPARRRRASVPTPATIVPGKPGSLDLSGTLPNALGVLTTAACSSPRSPPSSLTYWRAVESNEALVVGFAASVTAFVAFSKVISPQFLVWLVPLVPLVARRVGLVASALPARGRWSRRRSRWSTSIRCARSSWPVWVLLARNVMLVALFVLLLLALRAHVRRPEPVRSGP